MQLGIGPRLESAVCHRHLFWHRRRSHAHRSHHLRRHADSALGRVEGQQRCVRDAVLPRHLEEHGAVEGGVVALNEPCPEGRGQRNFVRAPSDATLVRRGITSHSQALARENSLVLLEEGVVSRAQLLLALGGERTLLCGCGLKLLAFFLRKLSIALQFLQPALLGLLAARILLLESLRREGELKVHRYHPTEAAAGHRPTSSSPDSQAFQTGEERTCPLSTGVDGGWLFGMHLGMQHRVLVTACSSATNVDFAGRICRQVEQYAEPLNTALTEKAAGVLEALERSTMLIADLSQPVDARRAFEAGMEISHALFRSRIPTLCVWQVDGDDRLCPLPLLDQWRGDPLLFLRPYEDEAQLVAAIDSMLAPVEAPGRVFVVEGGDGAGKQTQTAALVARLRREGYPVNTMDFPHDAALHGKLIRRVLAGDFGDMNDVNPLLFSSLYAQNRHAVRPVLQWWVDRGVNIVLDRYVEANFGHQACKLPEDGGQREALVDQLAKFEFDWLGLPRSKSVVYLDLPPSVALDAMVADSKRAKLDMHETASQQYAPQSRVGDGRCPVACAHRVLPRWLQVQGCGAEHLPPLRAKVWPLVRRALCRRGRIPTLS